MYWGEGSGGEGVMREISRSEGKENVTNGILSVEFQ